MVSKLQSLVETKSEVKSKASRRMKRGETTTHLLVMWVQPYIAFTGLTWSAETCRSQGIFTKN